MKKVILKNAMKKFFLSAIVLLGGFLLRMDVNAATRLDNVPNANIEFSYTSNVTAGTIRYIQQNSGSYFNSTYWGAGSTMRGANV